MHKLSHSKPCRMITVRFIHRLPRPAAWLGNLRYAVEFLCSQRSHGAYCEERQSAISADILIMIVSPDQSATDFSGKQSITGTVSSIVYQNDDNGYTVCEIETESGEDAVLTGILPFLVEGDCISAIGTWVNQG